MYKKLYYLPWNSFQIEDQVVLYLERNSINHHKDISDYEFPEEKLVRDIDIIVKTKKRTHK